MSNHEQSLETTYLTPRHLPLLCSRCGRKAVEYIFLPADSGPEDDPWRGSYRMRCVGFMGTTTLLRPVEELVRLFAALEQRDFREVWRVDADAAGFYCPDCEAVYCETCWHLGPPLFDEDLPGFYDSTEAVCPRGHRHVVDD